ncbi:MAG: hypothetical protein MK182_09895 [Acidimicrobiales bacterium]|jgi:hypothetical protein|nr:hypothetical protein [Acidimicrobiales bacterium]
MAHFAELNESNEVVNVVVLGDDNTADADGVEDEAIGIAWLLARSPDSQWVQTSYNNIRFRYARIGMTFDAGRDAFIEPSPFPSWMLNDSTTEWEAPTPMPDDGNVYYWDEDTTSWVEVPDA